MVPQGGNEPFPLLSIDGPRVVGNSNPELFEGFRRLPGPDEQDCEVEADDCGMRELGGQRA
jgi:hypothetical protein